MKEIEQEFEEFITMCYKEAPPTWMKRDLARCFYSGALSSFKATLKFKSHKEIETFMLELKGLMVSLTDRN